MIGTMLCPSSTVPVAAASTSPLPYDNSLAGVELNSFQTISDVVHTIPTRADETPYIAATTTTATTTCPVGTAHHFRTLTQSLRTRDYAGVATLLDRLPALERRQLLLWNTPTSAGTTTGRTTTTARSSSTVRKEQHLAYHHQQRRRRQWTCLHVAARYMVQDQGRKEDELQSTSTGTSTTLTTTSAMSADTTTIMTSRHSERNENTVSTTACVCHTSSSSRATVCDCCHVCDPWQWFVTLVAQAAEEDTRERVTVLSNKNNDTSYCTKQQQPSNHESMHDLWMARDKGGETCFDIFFGQWFAPPRPTVASSLSSSPSRARSATSLFYDSLERVLGTPELLHMLRQWCGDHAAATTTQRNRTFPTHSHVGRVARVWKAALVLCQAAATAGALQQQQHSWTTMLPFLARLGSCPERLARLAVALTPDLATDVPRTLHVWCQSPNPDDPDADNLLAVLLEVVPHAAAVPHTITQRLPWHTAAAWGKPFESLALLLLLQQQPSKATTGVPPLSSELEHIHGTDNDAAAWHRLLTHDQSLHYLDTPSVWDPVTQLPCFAVVATAARSSRSRSAQRGTAVSLHDWLTTATTSMSAGAGSSQLGRYDSHDPHNRDDCLRLEVLYQVIRARPNQLQSFSSFLAATEG